MYISRECYPVLVLREKNTGNPFVNFKNIGHILPKLLQKAEKSNLYKLLHTNMI